MKWHVRDYQGAAHDATLRSFGIGRWASMNLQEVHAPLIASLGTNPFKGSGEIVRSTVANLPTSAGKTIIASHIMESLHEEGMRIMFMADSDELCQQPVDKLRESTGLYASIEKAADRASMHSRIIVSSAQTMARTARRSRFPGDFFDLIIVDEAHRGCDRNRGITDHFHTARVLALTATAFRSGMKDLTKWFEEICFVMGTFDMIDQGYITPIRVMTLPIEISLAGVKESKSFGESDFDADDSAHAIEPYFQSICDRIKEHAPDRQIISFLPLVKSSQKFANCCQDNGIAARHVDGNSDDRKQILAGFERKDFQLLTNSNLLTTGWDCLSVDTLLNLRPTKSLGLFRQMVGRIVRLLKGVIDGIEDKDERKLRIRESAKPDALIMDVLWQYEKLIANPASLIANTEEEADQITKKLRKMEDGEFLDVVRSLVQKEKEDQLARMLAQNAKKKMQSFDALALAAMMHATELFDYEPMAKWERKAVSAGQRQLLERSMIDVDSIKDCGHASKVIDLIQKRKAAGAVPIEQLIELRKRGVEDLDKVTPEIAAEILGDDLPMPFGKHRGTPITALSKGYLRWLALQDWLDKWPLVHAYVQKWQAENPEGEKPQTLNQIRREARDSSRDEVQTGEGDPEW